MQDITTLIQDVRNKQNQIRTLKRELNISLEPKLKDTDIIDVIFEWYKDIYPIDNNQGRNFNTHYILCFMFIIILFYSPRVLIGARMRLGIRSKMAQLLNYTPCTISGYLQKVGFFYDKYKDYRDTINFCYSEIYKRLLEEGIISH